MNPSTTPTNQEQQPLLAGVELERRLEELLDQDRFPPPPGVFNEGSVRAVALHATAERDPNAFWAAQARTLHWDEPFTTVLDDSRPPFYKWFTDGKLNVSYNCLDRHVEAGRGHRVAFHWAGEDGEERTVTYAAAGRRAAARERAKGARGSQGRRRRDLPADDPGGRGRDAGVRADRSASQRRVRRLLPEAVKERMDVSRAKALITVDGARRKGKTAPVKATVDEVMGDLRRSSTSS